MMLHDTTFATAQDLASACARRTMNTWHVLDDRGHYLIADDADAAAWGDRVVWSVEPEMAFSAIELDPPGDSPLGDDEGDTLPSLYARLVAECQAELDARMAGPVVLDVEFAPVGWAA